VRASYFIANCKTPYNSPSLGRRELREGEIHSHPDPLPSREREPTASGEGTPVKGEEFYTR